MSNANFSADLLEMMKNGATAEDLAAQLAQALNDAETAYEKEQEEQRKAAAAKAEIAKATARKEFADTYMAAVRKYLAAIGEDTSFLDDNTARDSIEEALEFVEDMANLFTDLEDECKCHAACEKNFKSKEEKNNTKNFIKSDRDKITDFLNRLSSFL